MNGQGDDLAIFELGTPDSFKVTFNNTTLIYGTASTGDSAGGYQLNVALVDLSAFGVPISNVVNLGMDIVSTGGTVPSLSLVGALNSCPAPVPLPGAVWLLGSGLLGLVGLRKKSVG